MSIAPAFRSIAVQAILGPARSQLVPAALWVGWLDAAGDLIAMSGVRVAHDDFGPVGDGVANAVALDCGVAGSGWTIAAVGLFVDRAGSSMLMSATLGEPVTPTENEPLRFNVGGLVFVVEGELSE